MKYFRAEVFVDDRPVRLPPMIAASNPALAASRALKLAKASGAFKRSNVKYAVRLTKLATPSLAEPQV